MTTHNTNSKGTRYEKGDKVKYEEYPKKDYEVIRVENPQSDSPDYVIENIADRELVERNGLGGEGTVERYVVNASQLKKADEAVKEVTIKKSQLFELFHQRQTIGDQKRENFVLEIWEDKDTANTKRSDPHARYPDNAPIATVTWQSLTEPTRSHLPYHTSELDAKRNVRDNVREIDSVEEVDKEGVRTNIKITNGELLTNLWDNRRRELIPEENRYMEDLTFHKKIKINWVDDISATEFLEQKFDI